MRDQERNMVDYKRYNHLKQLTLQSATGYDTDSTTLQSEKIHLYAPLVFII